MDQLFFCYILCNRDLFTTLQSYFILFSKANFINTFRWKKLDPAAAETKKMVEDYFKWEGEDEKGRKFNQGKIFK